MDFVAIDFEAANEKRCSPCSIGIALVEDSKISATYHHLIGAHKGHFYFNTINELIHGISEEDVEEEPEFDALCPWLKSILCDHIVVAHNASFDFSVLRNTLSLYEIEPMDCRIACIKVIAMASWPDVRPIPWMIPKGSKDM